MAQQMSERVSRHSISPGCHPKSWCRVWAVHRHHDEPITREPVPHACRSRWSQFALDDVAIVVANHGFAIVGRRAAR
jgi:hypothetical protein